MTLRPAGPLPEGLGDLLDWSRLRDLLAAAVPAGTVGPLRVTEGFDGKGLLTFTDAGGSVVAAVHWSALRPWGEG